MLSILAPQSCTLLGWPVIRSGQAKAPATTFYPYRLHGTDHLIAQQALERITGQRPCYLRTPVGIRNLWLDAILVPLGLELVSWTRRGFDTASRDPRAIATRLLKGLSPGDILLLHDGWSLHGARGNPVVLEVLPRLLDAIAEHGLRSVAIDPS